MESRQLRFLFKIGAALAITSVIFHVVAFVSNGWFIFGYANTTYNYGLWYITKCDRNGDCETISRREQHEKNLRFYQLHGFTQSTNTLINYSNIVRWQMFETIALCCTIVCVVQFVIALYRHYYTRRTRIVTLTCSMLSGVVIVHDLAMDIRNIQLDIQHFENDDKAYFPWSLLILFFAALLISSVACICLIMEWKSRQRENQHLETDNQEIEQILTRKKKILGIVMTALSVSFRIVAFSSNAWRIINEDYLTTTHYDTSYYGLWYMTSCERNMNYDSERKHECETISMRNHIENTAYYGLNSYEYSSQVRSQVVLTLCLVLSIVCLVWLVIETRQNHNSLVRLSIMLGSLLSGIFWMYDIGHYMRIYVIDLETKYKRPQPHFPWSILFGLMGSILTLIVAFLRFWNEYKKKEIDDIELENIIPMDFTEQCNTDTDNDLVSDEYDIHAII